MKKLILCIMATCFSFLIKAQNYSNLTIGTTNGSNLKVRFAGKQYSLQDQKATFQNLNPGIHRLTIFKWGTRNNNPEWIEVFNSDITLTAQKHLEIIVLRFGKVVSDEGTIEKDDWNQNASNPYNNNSNNTQGTAVDDAQFQKIKKAISDQWSSVDKLVMAKGVMKYNLFTTAQLKSIMKLFFSDSDKLAFAKYGFDYCVDKGNYFTLADEFFSSSDKNSLMNYINSR